MLAWTALSVAYQVDTLVVADLTSLGKTGWLKVSQICELWRSHRQRQGQRI
jgi:hypothetical protein